MKLPGVLTHRLPGVQLLRIGVEHSSTSKGAGKIAELEFGSVVLYYMNCKIL